MLALINHPPQDTGPLTSPPPVLGRLSPRPQKNLLRTPGDLRELILRRDAWLSTYPRTQEQCTRAGLMHKALYSTSKSGLPDSGIPCCAQDSPAFPWLLQHCSRSGQVQRPCMFQGTWDPGTSKYPKTENSGSLSPTLQAREWQQAAFPNASLGSFS